MVKKLELFPYTSAVLELFPYTSAVLTLIYFENTSRRTRQMAGGLGMGVGKEKDWARKNKVVPCKSWKIVVVVTKKICELLQKNF